YFAHGSRATDKRYGIGSGETERKWERFDRRFDLAQEPNEVHRFGWVVELDPYDPTSTPRKRTALGRFKHEAATVRMTHDGRPVVYSGDDERFDYFYKFVGSKRMRHGTSRAAREHNLTLLDEGTLYVARLTGDSPAVEVDGTGRLPRADESCGSAAGSLWASAQAVRAVSHVEGMSADEVFVFTRLAGDKVGATKMDRPEDIEPNPVTGKVYVALTNNSNRGVGSNPGADEANPRRANKHGHVLELTEHRNRPESTRFAWSLFLVAGDPEDPATYFAGFPKDAVSPISCPDNVAFDDHGNLWISTDGSALGSHDGLFGVATRGSRRGELKQFLTVPRGAETCGPVIQDRRVLVAVQHPGEVDGATVEDPGSTWPDGPGTYVRPAVVAGGRAGGRDVGVGGRPPGRPPSGDGKGAGARACPGPPACSRPARRGTRSSREGWDECPRPTAFQPLPVRRGLPGDLPVGLREIGVDALQFRLGAGRQQQSYAERVAVQPADGRLGAGGRGRLDHGDDLAGGDQGRGGVVVPVQDARVESLGAQDPAHRVPLAVDGGVDHPAVVGQVGEAYDRLRRGRVVGRQADELRFPLEQYADPESFGDAQRAALD